MSVTLGYMLKNPEKYKVCKACNAFAHADDEVCGWCGSWDTNFDREHHTEHGKLLHENERWLDEGGTYREIEKDHDKFGENEVYSYLHE